MLCIYEYNFCFLRVKVGSSLSSCPLLVVFFGRFLLFSCRRSCRRSCPLLALFLSFFLSSQFRHLVANFIRRRDLHDGSGVYLFDVIDARIFVYVELSTNNCDHNVLEAFTMTATAEE